MNPQIYVEPVDYEQVYKDDPLHPSFTYAYEKLNDLALNKLLHKRRSLNYLHAIKRYIPNYCSLMADIEPIWCKTLPENPRLVRGPL